MKQSIIIKNYIKGLASFLDENDIEWKTLENDQIEIYYNDDDELFRIGFEFGKFYETI